MPTYLIEKSNHTGRWSATGPKPWLVEAADLSAAIAIGRERYPSKNTTDEFHATLQTAEQLQQIEYRIADKTLFLTCYHAEQSVRAGCGTRPQIKIAHVYGNLRKWLQRYNPEVKPCWVLLDWFSQSLGHGWWRRAVTSTPKLAELAALIRLLDRIVAAGNAVDNDESPWADIDNGKTDYAR